MKLICSSAAAGKAEGKRPLGMPEVLFKRNGRRSLINEDGRRVDTESLISFALTGHASPDEESSEQGENGGGGIASSHAEAREEQPGHRAGDALALTDVGFFIWPRLSRKWCLDTSGWSGHGWFGLQEDIRWS